MRLGLHFAAPIPGLTGDTLMMLALARERLGLLEHVLPLAFQALHSSAVLRAVVVRMDVAGWGGGQRHFVGCRILRAWRYLACGRKRSSS